MSTKLRRQLNVSRCSCSSGGKGALAIQQTFTGLGLPSFARSLGRTPTNLHLSDNHRLVRTLLHRQGLAGHLPLRSRLYRSSAVSWPESAESAKDRDPCAPGGNDSAALDTVLSAWGELDQWEGFAGPAKSCSTPSTQTWSTPNHGGGCRRGLLAAGSRRQVGRRRSSRPHANLAAVTLLGQPSPAVDQLRTSLQALLKSDLPQVWQTTFAAAWLEIWGSPLPPRTLRQWPCHSWRKSTNSCQS